MCGSHCIDQYNLPCLSTGLNTSNSHGHNSPETPQSHAADSAMSSLGVIRRSAPPVHLNQTAASLRYLDIQSLDTGSVEWKHI